MFHINCGCCSSVFIISAHLGSSSQIFPFTLSVSKKEAVIVMAYWSVDNR